MMEITLNKKSLQVEEGKTVLETARSEGIDIPTLCFHEALGPYGACRLCLVEAEAPMLRRQLIASCTLAVSPGLVVETDTPLVKQSRQVVFELLLGRAPDSEPLLELARKYGVESTRFPTGQSDNCVRCGLCVRVCRDKIGVSALCFAGRGQKKRVTAEFGKLSETCIGCTTCVNLCPADAIHAEDQEDQRRIFLKDNAISRQPLVPCRICGTYYHTQRFIDYVTNRSDLEEGLKVERDLCPACARRHYAQAIIGELSDY
jgi:NADH dehydrogenase/NADH:ubiquinone oxidoreductase subunit G